MAVYSEIISYSEIVSLINEIENKVEDILLIGCGACMNESLAFKNDVPIFVIKKNGEKTPYATTKEIDSIKEKLIIDGYNVYTTIIQEGTSVLCIYSDNNDVKLYSDGYVPDIALVMCCEAGVLGLRNKIYNIPIINITKQKGQLAYSYEDLDDRRIIDKKRSRVFYNK